MDFDKILKEKQESINANLKSFIPEKGIPKEIYQAMNYSLLAGGKRIRPVLLLTVCEALGGDSKEAMPFALSMECIHTYSLIHDDLPAMDNDDLRRGKPTNHKVYGEAIAILAGDALLNYAHESMLQTSIQKKSLPKYIQASYVISHAAGINGMVSGQVIDIMSQNKSIDIVKLNEMHQKKTGALIEASCLAGCILADDNAHKEVAAGYGKNLGIAFQIIDDILDYTGDPQKLGKSVGQDKQDDKSTFVSVLGMEKSRILAKQYTDEAIVLANEIDKSGFLTYITEYLLGRDS